jgi:hypothetical protein
MTGDAIKPSIRIGARNPSDVADDLLNEPPLSIGVRNPFVCAEYKLKEKIPWNEMKLEHKKIKLEQAFQMPYNRLFDPTKGSPLFVGDTRPCTPYPVNKWTPYPEVSAYVDTFGYTDPVQGVLPDCYFLAALSSVAFVTPEKLPNQMTAPYSYSFYKPPTVEGGPATKESVTGVSKSLPLDINNQYRYSKSFTPSEIWVAMYEKAFAKWKNQALGDKPDYSLICTGDPVLALLNLTGLKYTTYKTGIVLAENSTATRYSTQDFKSDATSTNSTKIFDKIRKQCIIPSYKVKFPMVTYTYDPAKETPPAGITYTDATIVANHAYSVLGVYSVAPNTYIVMRNPWGQMGVGPGSGDPSPSGLPSGALASGTWNGVNLAVSTDAIFALRADVFRDYFKGFGWVIQ